MLNIAVQHLNMMYFSVLADRFTSLKNMKCKRLVQNLKN